MTGWLMFLGYLVLWAWLFSPWFRFAVLPGYQACRHVPLWDWSGVFFPACGCES